jgi:integrase
MRSAARVQKRLTAQGKVRYTGIYYTADGRSHGAGTFSSKRAAQQAADEKQVAVREHRWHDPSVGRTTFRAYVEQIWWPGLVLEPSTAEAYESYLRNRILPHLGEIEMGALLPTHIQSWVKAQQANLAPKTVNHLHAMVFAVCKDAVRNRVMVANPCEGTKLPVILKKPRAVLSPEQFARVVEALPEHWLMLQTAIETGMRWGELIALRPAQLNSLHNEVVVDRATSQVAGVIEDKAYPKDREPRRIAVPHWLIDELQAEITRRGLGPEDRIFINKAGGPLDRNNFRHTWHRRLAEAGLPRVSFKHLRSTYASWALEGGASVIRVQKNMGHEQLSTTQLYSEALQASDRATVTAIEKIRGVPSRPAAAWSAQ